MGKPKKQEKKESTFEVLKTPEIAIQNERGAQLFSLILKAENPNWGDVENPLANEVNEYFKKNPLSPNIKNGIQELHESGVDEELLYNLALAYENPERLERVFEMAAKYKPHIKNPQEVQQKFFDILQSFDRSFSSSPLSEKFQSEAEQDKNRRQENLEETRERIEKLIDFFKPDSATTKVQKIIFVPTDPLYKKNSGRNFSFGREQIIISHIDDVENQEHEFLHGVINPIVDKLSQKLTDGEKEKISQLGSGKLKQDYGEGYYSLLCEEFIRTYNDILKKGERPQTYEDFRQKISEISDDQFQGFLSESESLKARCEELGIKSIVDFKNKSQEYFERFEKNQLRDLIFKFYQEYSSQSDKSGNFEQFILDRFTGRI